MKLPVAPVFPKRVFDIRKFGAVAGGKSLCSQAIATAVDKCTMAGGGRVLIPDGIWLTGSIYLESNVELHLSDGAELRFSQNFDDYLPPVFMQRGGVRCYGYCPFIYANGSENIAITGKGTLNGQGEVWWPWKDRQPGMTALFRAGAKGTPVKERVYASEADGVRPPFIQPINCRNVLIEGVRLIKGPSWNIHPVCCEELIVRGVEIDTHGPNNDGIDPDSCKNVLIEDCTLDTGDDCICLKSGRDQDGWAVGKPCENVVVRRCRTKHGHGGIVFGSEMSGGIRNVFVEDCNFTGTDRGIRIKSTPGRGGFIENLWFQNIEMDKIRGEAIHITLRYVRVKKSKYQPRIRNINISNVSCAKAKRAIDIEGLEVNYIQDLKLENIRMKAQRGLSAEYARNLKLKNVDLQVKEEPLFRLKNCQQIELSACDCPEGTRTFLQVEGVGTENVRLTGMDLKHAKTPIELKEGARADMVQR